MEVFVLALARACGLPAVTGHLAERAESSRSSKQQGLVVLSMLERTDSLVSGEALLGGSGFEARRSSVTHTLSRVRNALLSPSMSSGAVIHVTRMLCFDAWVGNGDRHALNWSAIEQRDGSRSLAPMYDPASCLGAELQNGYGLLEEPARAVSYIRRCGSGFGNDVRRIRMAEVVAELRGWPEWAANVTGWLTAFRGALAERVEPMLMSCPEAWWPMPRRQLARTLLEQRLSWLEELEAGGGGG